MTEPALPPYRPDDDEVSPGPFSDGSLSSPPSRLLWRIGAGICLVALTCAFGVLIALFVRLS